MIEIFTKLSILASNFSAGQQSRTVRLPLVFHFFQVRVEGKVTSVVPAFCPHDELFQQKMFFL